MIAALQVAVQIHDLHAYRRRATAGKDSIRRGAHPQNGVRLSGGWRFYCEGAFSELLRDVEPFSLDVPESAGALDTGCSVWLVGFHIEQNRQQGATSGGDGRVAGQGDSDFSRTHDINDKLEICGQAGFDDPVGRWEAEHVW